MFVTSPLDTGGLQVLALEAATGDVLWRYVRELPADARKHRNKMNCGVAGFHQYHHNGSWNWDEADPPLVHDHVDRARGTRTHVLRGGMIWVFALKP